ncbi:MAG: hypothetical protein ACF8XB_14950, partial [Planctomycetota bacterium JB042]
MLRVRTAGGIAVCLGTLGILGTLGGCGLGRISPEIVELYDMAEPGGVIEIEVDRDGSIREMEADIDPADLPAAVRDAAMAMAPGGTITGAEREFTLTSPAWEVKIDDAGVAKEFVVDEKGNVIESEREIPRAEAPPAVLRAADEAVVGGDFVSVEVIEHGSGTEYHVKKSRGGARYKVVVAPDGT